MENLLKETEQALKEHKKTLKDVEWIGKGNYFMSIDSFKKIANKEYDNGYGGNEVDLGLKICGDNWWLERAEYDGSEWWEFKQKPKKPKLNNEEFSIFEK